MIEPQPRRRYELQELLSQCDPNAPISVDDRQWMDLQPVGREERPETGKRSERDH